ncbi:MAG: hypothetical protein JWM80_580 [Cyanobacteria bacterium RYN_339]|nr:hypothetical protein [Cyanobacteria bacterium RYN_339]
MLGLERRIVLEDHLGEKHALHLLEVIEERFFVLLPPAYATELAALQEDNDLDEAIEILAAGLGVLGAHDHRFVPGREVPAILARSVHHVLKLCGLRLADDLPDLDAGELSPIAFSDECKRRQSW